MILTSNITTMETVKQVCPEGWVRDYVEKMQCARFPLSFHLLCGIFALSSIVGRRARLARAGYRLYPPTWIMLLGTSGVGKGKAMRLARLVVNRAADDFPFLIHNPDTFTRRGLIRSCQEFLRENELTDVEGAVMVDEISAVLQARTGTDTNLQFFIKASDMEDVEDMTGYLGAVSVRNFTVGVAANSTIELLRQSVNASAFSGGFMHRFLCAHELQKPNTPEADPSDEDITSLAQRAKRIRAWAPDRMTVDPPAEVLLASIARRSELSKFPDVHLAGFWNRFEGLCAKVALVYALSQMRGTILVDDVRKAETLIQGHLYKPLVELVGELAYGPAKQSLMKAADDLYFAGVKGMSLERFTLKLPGATSGQSGDQLRFLTQNRLVVQGSLGGKPWVWRLPKWKEKATLLEESEPVEAPNEKKQGMRQ